MSTNKKSMLNMSAADFIDKSFLKGHTITDEENNKTIEELNKNFFNIYYCKSPDKGGKSGATVYLLYKDYKEVGGEPIFNNLMYVFKFNEEGSKSFNKERRNSTNSNTSNVSNSSSSSISSNSSNKTLGLNNENRKKTVKFDNSEKYIRAVREIYLSKKFTEKQNNEKEKITPQSDKIGFLKNFNIIPVMSKVNGKNVDTKKIKIEKKNQQNKDIFTPFILQEGAEGTELENYVFFNIKKKIMNVFRKKNKKVQLNDTLCYNILYQLGIALMKFNKLITKENNNTKFIGCHRDMHPGNIFVKKKDKNDVSIMFIDFDLSITNSKKLSINNSCTRRTLSWKQNDFVKQYIATTGSYTKRNARGVFHDYFLISHNLFKEDADLYQYIAYYTYYYNNVKSNYIKLFLKDSLEKAIETINKNLQNKNLKYKFLESLTNNLYQKTNNT